VAHGPGAPGKDAHKAYKRPSVMTRVWALGHVCGQLPSWCDGGALQPPRPRSLRVGGCMLARRRASDLASGSSLGRFRLRCRPPATRPMLMPLAGSPATRRTCACQSHMQDQERALLSADRAERAMFAESAMQCWSSCSSLSLMAYTLLADPFHNFDNTPSLPAAQPWTKARPCCQPLCV
jgi:hypothetical protein